MRESTNSGLMCRWLTAQRKAQCLNFCALAQQVVTAANQPAGAVLCDAHSDLPI